MRDRDQRAGAFGNGAAAQLRDAVLGGDDIGAPPYFPMARAIIGGLGFSTMTSLLLVPYLYVVLDDLSRWGRKVMQVARSARSPQAVGGGE